MTIYLSTSTLDYVYVLLTVVALLTVAIISTVDTK